MKKSAKAFLSFFTLTVFMAPSLYSASPSPIISLKPIQTQVVQKPLVVLPKIVTATPVKPVPQPAPSVAMSRGLPHMIFYVQDGNDITAANGQVMDLAVDVQIARIRNIFREMWKWDLPDQNLHFFTGADYTSGRMAVELEKIANQSEQSPVDMITLSHSNGTSVLIADNASHDVLEFLSVIPKNLKPRLRFFMNTGCFASKSIQLALLSGFKVAAGTPETSIGNLITDFFLRSFTEGASYKQALSHSNWACRNTVSWTVVIRAVPSLVPGDFSSQASYCNAADLIVSSRVPGGENWTMVSQVPLTDVNLAPEAEEITTAGQDLGYRWDGTRCTKDGLEGLNPDFFGECGDLSHADLSFMDFAGQNLKGADFSHSLFVLSDLYSADLQGATFHDAAFVKTDLSRADLRKADLSKARFYFSRFYNNLFSQTDFGQSKILLSDFSPTQSFQFTDLSSISGRTLAFGAAATASTGRRTLGSIVNADVRGVDLNELFDVSTFCSKEDAVRKNMVKLAVFDQYTKLPLCVKQGAVVTISKEEAQQKYEMVYEASSQRTDSTKLTELYPGLSLYLPAKLPAVRY